MKKELLINNPQNYKKSRKELRIILTALRGWISRNYGKRCGERANGCFVCIAYAIYDVLETYLEK